MLISPGKGCKLRGQLPDLVGERAWIHNGSSSLKQSEPDRLLDIVGMSRRVTVSQEQLTPAFTMVAKVKLDPLLGSHQTTFMLRMTNIEGDWMEELELPFAYPTPEQWTHGVWPMIRRVLSGFEFLSAGEYAVEAYHNGNLIGRETFALARQEQIILWPNARSA